MAEMKCNGRACIFVGDAQEWLTLTVDNSPQVWAEANEKQGTTKEVVVLYACPMCGNVQIFR